MQKLYPLPGPPLFSTPQRARGRRTKMGEAGEGVRANYAAAVSGIALGEVASMKPMYMRIAPTSSLA